MRRTFYLFVIVLASLQLVAQSAQQVPCAYDHYAAALEQQYPGFRQASQAVLAHARSAHPKSNEVYTIPVVVHVVWKEAVENVADQQIEDIIAVLNEDYRRLNLDANNVRAIFDDVVADPLIQFELKGVERVQTDATFELNLLAGSLPDNVKQSSEGGSDAWDTEQYLNIWVCNIQGGSLLGYAYPPAGLEHWPEGANAPEANLDGVVIHHAVFKRTGTYTTTGLFGLGGEITVPIRGRAVTHEVGHYLGLRHIWGDGLLSILGIPDCSADDGVTDTPNQGTSSQFQCNAQQNTCTDSSNDRPDMFENFMDYATDDCANSFTQQQIAIMRGVLENERKGLLTTTSTQDPLAAAGFKLLPNPAAGTVTLLTDWEAGTAYSLRLLDMRGRVLRAEQGLRTASHQLDLTGLSAGVYTVLLEHNGAYATQRLIVK